MFQTILMTSMKLTFIRHGQAEHNRNFRLNETNKQLSRLTDLGQRQAEAMANKLAKQPFTMIYSSSLLRAKQTAKIVQSKHSNQNLKLVVDKRLDEFQTGSDNRSALIWSVGLLLTPNKYHHKPKGGESLAESVERIRGWLTDVRTHHQPTILVVAHLHTYRVLRFLLEDKPLRLLSRQDRLPTGQAHRFDC